MNAGNITYSKRLILDRKIAHTPIYSYMPLTEEFFLTAKQLNCLEKKTFFRQRISIILSSFSS